MFEIRFFSSCLCLLFVCVFLFLNFYLSARRTVRHTKIMSDSMMIFLSVSVGYYSFTDDDLNSASRSYLAQWYLCLCAVCLSEMPHYNCKRLTACAHSMSCAVYIHIIFFFLRSMPHPFVIHFSTDLCYYCFSLFAWLSRYYLLIVICSSLRLYVST